jgi:hypothetical protein
MPDWNTVSELSFEEQVPIYRSHLEANPSDAAIWFDLGLAHKHLLQWKACVNANRRALEISNAPEDPAWWNLGIAATALRDWNLARKAWRGYGLEINGDDGPIECDYGMAPVRLPHGEVVWGKRLDPARLIIRNVPLPDTDYRWGDVVLHDGAPNGERVIEERTYGVFDVLEKWSPSEIPTYQVSAVCPTNGDAQALVDLFDTNHFAAEDWTANVRNLCRACSEGNPDGHDHPFGTSGSERNFGLASPLGLAEQLLAEWSRGCASRTFGELRLT